MSEIRVAIYPAGNRPVTDDVGRRCRHTFDDGHSMSSHRRHFKRLLMLNDEMLGPGHVVARRQQASAVTIILPVEGAVQIVQKHGQINIDVGSIGIIKTGGTSEVMIQSKYRKAWINYLELLIADDHMPPAVSSVDFDIVTQINTLTTVDPGIPGVALHLGRYMGREDGSLVCGNPDIFAFVVDGVCEINDRLLEARDGLALQGCRDVRFESLSPQSVVLFISGV